MVKSKRYLFKKTRELTYIVGSLFLLLSGCSIETAVDGGGEETITEPVPITIRLVTQFGAPGTRALTATDEGRVDDVYVFFLRSTDGKVHSVATGKSIQNTSDTQKTFTTDLVVAGSAGQQFRCLVLANAGSLLGTQNLNLYKEKTYAELQDMLVSSVAHTAAPALAAGDFVMWGEANETVEATRRPQNVTVNMLRSVARVDLGIGVNPGAWNGKDAANADIPFKLKKVFVFKPNNREAYMPETGAYNAATQRVTLPSPAGAAVSIDAPFEYTVPQTIPAATAYRAEIYLPEADILQGASGTWGDANHANRCAIVVQGQYKDHPDSWYRIDFRNGANLVDLLRNHRYLASISSVSGDGESSPREAYETRRVNMQATVLDWNDWSQDVIFDGVDYVYIQQKSILLPGNAGLQGAIRLESNVDISEWQVKIEGPGGNTAFGAGPTVENTHFKVTLPAANAGNLMIETKTLLPDPVNGDPYTSRTATVTIKIHRLEFKVQIEQRSDTPDDWQDGGEIPKEIG